MRFDFDLIRHPPPPGAQTYGAKNRKFAARGDGEERGKTEIRLDFDLVRHFTPPR